MLPSDRGLLLVFEGPDGVGKSTLAAALASFMGTRTKCTLLAFPGAVPGTLGKHVYEMHHNPGAFGIDSICAESLQTLHVAAHIDAIASTIKPALSRGECIVLDRYWWSTFVYGCASGASSDFLHALIECERMHWGDTLPDAAFLITRTTPLRATDAGPGWTERCELYKSLAEREKARHPVEVIDNGSTELSAEAHVKMCMDALGLARGT